MSIRLRPHHLLCVLSYVGRGYTPSFTENMNRLVPRILSGEAIEIVAGPDAICTPLLTEPDCHCRRDSVAARDRAAADALGVRTGEVLSLTPERVAAMRADFAAGTIRAACRGCEWDGLCSEVAARFSQ